MFSCYQCSISRARSLLVTLLSSVSLSASCFGYILYFRQRYWLASFALAHSRINIILWYLFSHTVKIKVTLTLTKMKGAIILCLVCVLALVVLSSAQTGTSNTAASTAMNMNMLRGLSRGRGGFGMRHLMLMNGWFIL